MSASVKKVLLLGVGLLSCGAASADEGPGDAVLAGLQERLLSYTALQMSPFPVEVRGLSPAEEDALLRERLAAKVALLEAVEVQATLAAEAEEAEVRGQALVYLGAAYEELAASLSFAVAPSYLSPRKAEQYRLALEDRAAVPLQKARAAYILAAETAEDEGLRSEWGRTATDRAAVLSGR